MDASMHASTWSLKCTKKQERIKFCCNLLCICLHILGKKKRRKIPMHFPCNKRWYLWARASLRSYPFLPISFNFWNFDSPYSQSNLNTNTHNLHSNAHFQTILSCGSQGRRTCCRRSPAIQLRVIFLIPNFGVEEPHLASSLHNYLCLVEF